jgi:imidazoleglycerol-phosphate dehydratase
MKAALGDRKGIERYGSAYAPLDEALARVVIDISGRPFLEFNADMPEQIIGVDFASSLVEEFWRSLAMNAGLTMHIDLLRARNSHHAAEAIFKAAAVALRTAVRRSGPEDAVPSTKGMLA